MAIQVEIYSGRLRVRELMAAVRLARARAHAQCREGFREEDAQGYADAWQGADRVHLRLGRRRRQRRRQLVRQHRRQ